MEWISVKDRLPEKEQGCICSLFFEDIQESIIVIAYYRLHESGSVVSMNPFRGKSPTGCHYLACRRNRSGDKKIFSEVWQMG